MTVQRGPGAGRGGGQHSEILPTGRWPVVRRSPDSPVALTSRPRVVTVPHVGRLSPRGGVRVGSILDSSFRQAGPAVPLCLATLLPTLGLPQGRQDARRNGAASWRGQETCASFVNDTS